MGNAIVGNQRALRVSFYNAAGQLADPDGITLTVKDPNGARTVYTYGASAIVKEAVGQYRFVLTLALVGTYGYGWAGTGAVIVNDESSVGSIRSALG